MRWIQSEQVRSEQVSWYRRRHDHSAAILSAAAASDGTATAARSQSCYNAVIPSQHQVQRTAKLYNAV